ncbi:hypothetical protein QQG74_27010 [Micromonospora sp. FIMYZ51]|uniref:hypothetical protein n=1 Tax=Micromonospora sp. FIMYZ51 TaxID=3051832 RepID=UPI00311F3027
MSLALAGGMLLSVLWGLVAVEALFDGREHRSRERTPVLAEKAVGQPPAGWYREGADTVDDRQFSVVGLVNEVPTAPPPPGIPRWPAPGEAFVSPALLASGEADEVRHRYGRLAGTIAPDGLTDGAEFFVYYQPPGPVAAAVEGWEPVARFGAETGYAWAGEGRGLSRNQARLLVALLGLPAAFLAFVALGSLLPHAGRPVSGVPTAPGGPARRVIGDGLGPFLALLAGICTAGLALAVLSRRSFTLPLTEYPVDAADLATTIGRLPLLGAAVLIFLSTVLAALTVAHLLWSRRLAARPTRGTPIRPTEGRFAELRSELLQWTLLIGFVLGVWGAVTGGDTGLVMVGLGVLASSLVLPFLVVRLSRSIGRWLSARAHRDDREGLRRGARMMESQVRAPLALAAMLVIALSVLGGLHVVLTMRIAPVAESLRLVEVAGHQVVSVRSPSLSRDIEEFDDSVAGDRVLRIYLAEGDEFLGPQAVPEPRLRIVGSCAALRLIGDLTECPTVGSPLQDAYRSYHPFGGLLIATGVLPDSSASGPADVQIGGQPGSDRLHSAIVMNGGGEAGYGEIKRTAYATLALPEVTLPGQEWRGVAVTGADNARWLVLTGYAVVLLAALTCGIAGTASGLRLRRPDVARPGSTLRELLYGVSMPLVTASIVVAIVALAQGAALTGALRSGAQAFSLIGFSVPAVAVISTVVCVAAALVVRPASRADR